MHGRLKISVDGWTSPYVAGIEVIIDSRNERGSSCRIIDPQFLRASATKAWKIEYSIEFNQ